MHLLAHGCSCFEGHAGTSEAGKLWRQQLHTYGVKWCVIQAPRFSEGFVICLKMIFGHGSLAKKCVSKNFCEDFHVIENWKKITKKMSFEGHAGTSEAGKLWKKQKVSSTCYMYIKILSKQILLNVLKQSSVILFSSSQFVTKDKLQKNQ